MKEVSGLRHADRLYKVTLISLEVTLMPFGFQMGPLVCGVSFQHAGTFMPFCIGNPRSKPEQYVAAELNDNRLLNQSNY